MPSSDKTAHAALRPLTAILLLLPCTIAATRAYARDQSGMPSPLIDLTEGVTFEIAPHTGLMGSSGTFGLQLSMNYGSFNVELAAEQVIGRTANLYPISVNAVINLATHGRLIPYGAVGGGLWLTVPTGTVGAETVSTLGLNFGGGARFYLSRSFGFRIEAKQYITSVENKLDAHSELLLYQEISVGVTFMLR